LSFIKNISLLFIDYPIFSVGLLLFAGYFLGKLFEKFKLPAITGYILAGLLMSESVSGLVLREVIHELGGLTDIALGIIALTIGSEFEFNKIKKTGIKILTLTLFEALFAFIFVTTVLTLLNFQMQYALLLGAISSATAPAATVIIIKEMRARGEFVDYLYGVVAFDDAVCVILFSVIFAMVTPALTGIVTGSVFHSAIHAFLEILYSCILGFFGGVILHLLTKRYKKENAVLIVSISLIFMILAISIVLNLSSLITNMVFGATLINLSKRNRKIFDMIEPMTPPLFALFFILAGTELQISVFKDWRTILFGFSYLASRFAGKYTGIFTSSLIVKAPSNIKKYLGFCLFPQAGVAIGLSLFIQSSPIMLSAPAEVKNMMILIVNIVLFSVFINELVGPIISKFGIIKGLGLSKKIKYK